MRKDSTDEFLQYFHDKKKHLKDHLRIEKDILTTMTGEQMRNGSLRKSDRQMGLERVRERERENFNKSRK